MTHTPFTEVALLLLCAAVAGAIVVRLRQPVLIAYIVPGIALVPAGFHLVTAHDQIDLLAQIGEFSIVFVAMGISLGHVGVSALSLTTLVGLITITLSTYMILYSHPLYERLAPWLRVFERSTPHRGPSAADSPGATDRSAILVVGVGRFGGRLLDRLRARGIPVLGVDFDPDAVASWQRRGAPGRFGDVTDPDFLETLPLASLRWVISTVPDGPANLELLHALKACGYRGQVAVAVRDDSQARLLAGAGVDRVIDLFDESADQAVLRICDAIARPERVPVQG